ncbi:MAG: MBL fold metallo-hydrolase [Planctomycetota bacterium]|jgi:glyoxylase-like metal-dependent hydrolase (beta-lactamase superfamily II)|nr:MBL fold metallo-hydrolase [Planctomycetota bacterium]MDP6940591.1 MBL fold metallo-hydrolase [Planctomycetota bacterium]
MLEVHEVPVTPYQQNATLLLCTETMKAAACDVGDSAPILERASQLGCTIEIILGTHGHLDHIAGTANLMELTSAPFYFPQDDDFLRETLPQQAAHYGWAPVQVPEVNRNLKGGERVEFGNITLEVLHCPGHTPGHICFYEKESGRLIAGDVIFAGSVGRTDFPKGSWEDLQNSIRHRLYPLPAETVVHCGHGPSTTIGREAATNPFVRA